MSATPFSNPWRLAGLLIATGTILTSILSTEANELAQKSSGRTVVISIDALRPDFYLSSKSPMTELKKLKAQGAWAKAVLPIFPSVTYPSHTSILTGTPPTVHGITANTDFDRELGVNSRWLFETVDTKGMTVWKLARKQKKRLAVLHWPVSLGADADFLIPEILEPKTFSIEASWNLARPGVLPKNFLSEIPSETPTNLKEEDHYLALAATTILDGEKADLLFVHFTQSDLAQHAAGPKSKALEDALKDIDSLVSEISKRLDFTKDTLFVVGDHGFFEVSKRIHLYAVLKKEGLSEKDGSIFSSGGSAAIYLKNPKVVDAWIKAFQKNESAGFKVLEGKNFAKLEGYPGAAFAIDALNGAELSAKKNAEALEEKLQTPIGTHGASRNQPEMTTGIIVIGPKVAKDKDLGTVDLLEIAPTLAKYSGLPYQGFKKRPLDLEKK